MKRHATFVAFAALVLASGCANDTAQPQPPQPGVLTLTLEAPDDSTGGALITLTGAAVDSVTPVGALVYGTAATASTGASVLLAGALSHQTVVASVYVPDVHLVGDYQVVVQDAANGVTNEKRAAGTVSARLSAP